MQHKFRIIEHFPRYMVFYFHYNYDDTWDIEYFRQDDVLPYSTKQPL